MHVHLSDNLREQLKIPLGHLLVEDKTSKENILKLIPSNSFIITVGDATTEKMLNYEITPALQIVDGIEKREKREFPKIDKIETELTCDNPAGEITRPIDRIRYLVPQAEGDRFECSNSKRRPMCMD